MKEFTHFILTRFNSMLMPDGMLYDDINKANKWMDERMELFRACRDSVLSQEGDFQWVISLDNRTPNRYLQEIFTDERMRMVHCDFRDTFSDVEISTPWVITSRLDCDDQYKPGAIKAIQSKFEPKLKVIDIGFDQLEWETGKVFPGEDRWSGSMFISLVEPSHKVLTAFCRPHGQVATEYPMLGDYKTKWKALTRIAKENINDKLALMVCHGNNITNAIRK